jgi:protocatechuate 3,4-dioxygenase, alpha subunit
MELFPSPSQTIGPFFHVYLNAKGTHGSLVKAATQGQRISLVFRVRDANDVPVPDALIEIWHADSEGRYRHPADSEWNLADPDFDGFGRLPTNAEGICSFDTVKPGAIRSRANGELAQAPHVNVTVFARGLLLHLVTRIYFADDPANQRDPVLALVPEDRRHTLLAHVDAADAQTTGVPKWIFDIHLQGPRETVFFDA